MLKYFENFLNILYKIRIIKLWDNSKTFVLSLNINSNKSFF